MRIHLTGMSPRTASERARERVTFARTLGTALSEMGHLVDRAVQPRGHMDLMMVGVTSPLSPGATYALVGLEAIGRALQEDIPLLLFVDDPALDKTRSGALSAQRDLNRLYTDYLTGKRVGLVRDPNAGQRDRIKTAVEMLASEHWPITLLPMHPWASAAIATRRLGVFSKVVTLDVSAMLDTGGEPASTDVPRALLWLTNQHYSKETLAQSRVSWPVIPVDSSKLPDPVAVYAAARGVHQGVIGRIPGWWTPTPQQVAQARTVYLCSTEESVRIGTESPYYLTPDDVERLDEESHAKLAEAQAAHLKEVSWDQETLSSALVDVIGRSRNSTTPDTTRPTSATS